MDRPPPDASKLLSSWMEWERGETPPGRVMSELKTGGMRDLLEQLVTDGAAPGASGPSGSSGADEPEPPSTEVWKPVV